ncbi:MAG TPA: hypothetical protein VGQ78_04805 [Vicinamibacteria bacterium]|nr:hypothetical protein [Vicinamibacteria bacterium]
MRRALATLAWGAVPVALSRWPALVARVPALGVLRGPLGLGLLFLAAAVAAGRLWRPRLRFDPGPRVLFAAAAALYLSAGLWYTSRLRVSGDEPHYLLMAQSLWREHDLDLQDNLEREDYREYTPGPLAPHWGAPRRDGRPFPAHSPGLPLILAPAYAAGGRLACVALLALAAAAATIEARALALGLTGDTRAALLGWASATGPPLAFYAFHVYTEAPSALALALCLRLLLGPAAPSRAAVAAALTVALPGLHVKMIPAAAALGLVALVRLRGRPLAAFAAVVLAGAIGYGLYFAPPFGRPSPFELYHGLPQYALASPVRGGLGLLLDRSFGLLPYAPVFLLAGAGLATLVFGRRRDAWPYVLVAVAVLAPLPTWRMWWGGQCPPARFLVPLVPLLAVAVATRTAEARGRGLSRWSAPLAAAGFGLFIFMTVRPAELMLLNRGDRPTRVWAALSADAPVERYLPSLVAGGGEELRVALLWAAALASLVGLDRLALRREAVDRLFRGLGLPVGLLLGIGVLVDDWARRSG